MSNITKRLSEIPFSLFGARQIAFKRPPEPLSLPPSSRFHLVGRFGEQMALKIAVLIVVQLCQIFPLKEERISC